MVHTGLGADGRYYSHFSMGQSLLALPLFAAGRLAEDLLPEEWLRALVGPERWLGDRRVGGKAELFAVGFYSPIAAGLLAAVFFLFQRALGTSLRSAAACTLALATSTYVATQSTFFLRHISESLTLFGGLYFFFRWKQHGRDADLWIGSALASLTLLVRFPAATAGPSLAAYLLWCVWVRSGRRLDPALLRRALPAVLTPLLLVLAISAWGDIQKWGRPWNVHQFRTASSLHTPMGVSLYGFLLSPGLSVFVYTPLLALAPWTLGRLWRERRAEALVVLALALSFLLTFARFTGWTGLWSSPGPRYLVLWIPLLLLPLGLCLDRARSRAAWAAFGGLAAVGLCVQLALMPVSWGALIEAEGYRNSHPKWAFLFMPDRSPVLGAARQLLSGHPVDLWIRTLWVAAPGAALGVAVAWLGALAATLGWVVRGVRAREAG